MIIKGQKETAKISPYLIFFGVLIAAYFVISLFIDPFTSNSSKTQKPNVIFCDAEHVDGTYFVNGDHKFSNSETQSSEESYSGSYSSKIDKNNVFGLTYKLVNPKKNTRYTVRVWRKTEYPLTSTFTIKSNDDIIYKEFNQTIKSGKNGWSLMEESVFVGDNSNIKELLFFPYIKDEAVAYFDDLTIIEEGANSTYFMENKLHLYLDAKALQKINAKREEALKLGILQSSDDAWVKAKLTANDSLSYDIKMRLKGDWTDHLKGNYWSYRVKMPSDKSWNRLQTFSLQDPRTRSYLDEWLFHKVLEDLDIISPRYGFVEFSQNNQDRVLYAYEEHFEKQIAEYRNRREGVIIKFGEDAFWEEKKRNLGNNTLTFYRGDAEGADIQVFKEKKTLNNPKLKEQFVHASNLLHGFQYGNLSATEVFDIDKLAKLYAIAEVFSAHHSLIWHNQRFYYNSITQKLEPIGYDGYTEQGPFIVYEKLFLGEFKTSKTPSELQSHESVFLDTTFNRLYVQYLFEFTDNNWISDVLSKYEKDLNKYEYAIRKEKKDYFFNKNKLTNRAKTLRDNISPMNNFSLIAYKNNLNGNIATLSVGNRHPLPLTIIGSGIERDQAEYNIDPVRINSSPMNGALDYQSINISKNHTYLYFKLEGRDAVYYSKIKNHPSPQNIKPSDITLLLPLPENSYTINGKTIGIKGGSYRLDSPIMVPEEYSLVFYPGVQIDFNKNSYFLCYGNVTINGTSDDPVIISSSDGTAQGFTVINPNKPVEITNTHFKNLGTLEEGNWQLTGAVTLYEADVKLDKVTISNNSCEDALNLIRSSFDINYLNINNTFADGFDGDFCSGKITNSRFQNTGNDGLDYSGSIVQIQDVTMKNIGDKGISAGEQATLTVQNVTIDGAQIGVASKDLSKVNINNIQLYNCNQGFTAYRKKPEFGGGEIVVTSYTADQVTQLLLADEESSINLPKK